MRTLDTALALLGLVALGLMLTNAPSARAEDVGLQSLAGDDDPKLWDKDWVAGSSAELELYPGGMSPWLPDGRAVAPRTVGGKTMFGLDSRLARARYWSSRTNGDGDQQMSEDEGGLDPSEATMLDGARHVRHASASTPMDCCLILHLSPEERAAQVRVLEQVLAPRGDSPESALDRLRLNLLLRHEEHLVEREACEIS